MAKEAKKYNNTDIIDPEKFGTQVHDKNMVKGEPTSLTNKDNRMNQRTIQETKPAGRTAKKVSGVTDIKMLDRLDNAKRFESPAAAILARGMTVQIKDIPKNTTLRGKVIE